MMSLERVHTVLNVIFLTRQSEHFDKLQDDKIVLIYKNDVNNSWRVDFAIVITFWYCIMVLWCLLITVNKHIFMT